MKIISAYDMAVLKDARGVLETIKGDSLGEVDLLIAACRIGNVGSLTGFLVVKAEVEGGVATVTRCPAGVEVQIRDHDMERSAPTGKIPVAIWRAGIKGRPRQTQDYA